MFIREGLLDPLSSALLNVMVNRGPTADEMKRRIITVLLVFCQVSQQDIHVRNALGTRKVVRSECPTIQRSTLVLNVTQDYYAHASSWSPSILFKC